MAVRSIEKSTLSTAVAISKGEDMNSTAMKLTSSENTNNIVSFPKIVREPHTVSNLKSNGVKKATPADPIRNIEDVQRVQQYFLDRHEIRNYTLFSLGVSFTLRIGDLLSIRFGDVFTTNGKVKKEVILREQKTTKRNKVSINSKCRQILDSYLDWTYKTLGRWPDQDEPLFFSRTSKQDGELKAISISMVDKVLRRVKRDLNLEEHLSSHSMRKTMIYHTIKNNNYDQATLYLLQRMLNHSDQRITFRYCGIEDEAIAQLREDMAGLLI